jgi:hypothetical protein
VVPDVPGAAAVPAQPSVSVKIEGGDSTDPAASAQKPRAAKKPKPAKPGDQSLSPLARLRARFQLLTHPSKPAPKKEAPGTTSHSTHLVTGARVPLPAADVAAQAPAPSVHGLYASDEGGTSSPDSTTVQTAPSLPATQAGAATSQVSVDPGAATMPGGSNEVEKWPHNQSTGTAIRSSAATTDSADDFTAIPDDEYRATVAKIAPADAPKTTAQWSTESTSTNAPPAQQSQAQSTESAPPPAPPALGSTRPNPIPGEAGAWMAIPKTSPKDSLRPAAEQAGSVGRNLSARTSAADAVRDHVVGAPSTVGWSPSAAQDAAIEPAASPNSGGSTQIEPNSSAETSINPGWSLPPAIYEEAAPTPRYSVAAVPSPKTFSGRYGQPIWTAQGWKAQSPSAERKASSTSPAVIRRAPTPPPTIVIRAADASHGGS